MTCHSPADFGAIFGAGRLTHRWALGNPTVFQNFTDSTENQHVVLLVLQNIKFKISVKSDQN